MAVQRIFPATSGPGSSTVDPAKYSLGVEFYPTIDCQLTAFYFWIADAAQSHANRVFRLYQCVGGDFAFYYEGTELNTGTIYVDGAWNKFPLSIPPLLVANQHYRAVVFCDDANAYSATGAFWGSDIVNDYLVAPSSANAFGGDQCQFYAGATEIIYPFDSFNAANYWIDVEVNDAIDLSQQGAAVDDFSTIIVAGAV